MLRYVSILAWVALALYFHGPIPVVALCIVLGVAATALLALSTALGLSVPRAAVALLAIWLISSFVGGALPLYLVLGLVLLLPVYRQRFRLVVHRLMVLPTKVLTLPGSFFYLGLAMATIVSMQGYFSDGHFLAVDGFHPLYELSVGQGYLDHLGSPTDYSYAGKKVYFHFLSTAVPWQLAAATHTHILTATYWLAPMLYLAIGWLMLFYLATRPILRGVPLWAILFIPVVWTSATSPHSLAMRYFAFDGSFSLGGVLVLCSLYFTLGRSWLWLGISLALLALAKGSYFISLAGAVGLYLLYSRQYKTLLQVLVPVALLFALTYILVYKHAHPHLWWVVAGPPVPGRWGSLWPVQVALLMGSLGVGLYSFYRHRDERRLLAATVVVGILLFFLLPDYSESNHYQFVQPAFVGHAVLVIGLVPTRKFVARLALIVIVCFCASTGLKTTVGTLCQHLHDEIGWLQNMYKVLLTHPYKHIIHSEPMMAYTQLAQRSTIGCVAFNPAYETVDNPAITMNNNHGPWRSVLSRQQMLRECFTLKGVFMQYDYTERHGELMKIASQYTYPSPTTAAAMYSYSRLPADTAWAHPLKELPPSLYYHGWPLSWLVPTSLNKEWVATNRLAYIRRSLYQKLKHRMDEPQKWLDAHNIRYWVLENGDRPTSLLQRYYNCIYTNSLCSIWERKPINSR